MKMVILDGWVNAFRQAADEPIESADALTADVVSYFDADPLV